MSVESINNFIGKKQVNGINIWFLGYIPKLKKPGYKYKKNENHWGDYYDYLKNSIHTELQKPDLIVLDKNSFYHYIEDCIVNNLNIKTLVI